MPHSRKPSGDDMWITDDESEPALPSASSHVAAGHNQQHPAFLALKGLRDLVTKCDEMKRVPKWWTQVSPDMWVHLDELEQQLLSLAAHQATAGAPAGLSSALADLKAQNAQVIDAIAQLAPATRVPRDSIVPSASGPQFRTPSFSLAVSLAAVPRDAPLLSLPPADIKAAIGTALRSSKVPALNSLVIHSVRLNRGKLFVHVTSDDHMALLSRFAEEWLPALGRGVKLASRKVVLQVDLVSTRFDPGSASALDALHLSNPTTIVSRDQLESVHWLHQSKAGKASRSSLALTVKDFDTARKIVYDGLCVLGEYCPANLLPPTVHQCYRCQGFGHESTQCLKQHPPRPLSCGRCASHDHSTGSCACPARPACMDKRKCTHITFCCANCRGPHKAFDSCCPVKTAAIERAISTSSYTALWKELTHKSP
ncbi:hypothetical protein EXIGLDRAFT_822376 [Exidia glandulosa HHB12029]|uniref:CCHC-type domain-containing protein n=1 Tax=Exidia glandulosa HHB12029 TaxID=1314781 RepID=A0A166N855_EXIGL|nr:hypothetical protein EXIGLDRAFT_822376 [Exidia glandulosa HHB12029]